MYAAVKCYCGESFKNLFYFKNSQKLTFYCSEFVVYFNKHAKKHLEKLTPPLQTISTRHIL